MITKGKCISLKVYVILSSIRIFFAYSMISQILHYKYLLFSFVILRLYLDDELNSRAGGGVATGFCS